MVPSAQALRVGLGDLVAEHRADGAVDVADRRTRARHRGAVVDGVAGGGDELVVEGLLEAVVLARPCGGCPSRRGCRTSARIGLRSRPEAFQWLIGLGGVEVPDLADRPPRCCGSRARRGARAPPRRCTRRRSRRTPGCPEKRARSSGFWVAMPTGQVSRWQTRIRMQPRHDERCGGEAELLGAEQGGDDDVAAGLDLAVDLHDDAVAQPVEHQGLLGLGQAELPRAAGVLEAGQRAGARCRRRGRR